MIESLALLVGILLVVLLVLAVLRRMVKLALYAAVLALLVIGVWWLVRERAPQDLRDSVERSASNVADEGAKLADRAGREAVAIGAEVASQVGRRVVEEGDKAIRKAVVGAVEADGGRRPDSDAQDVAGAGGDKP